MSRASVSEDRIAKAVAVVAGGSSVETAAKEVGVTPATIRRWMADPRWQPLYEQARLKAAAEAGAEAILVLRGLLRSKDEGVRARAAQTLASHAVRAVPAGDASAGTDDLREDLGDVTVEELREALRAVRTLRATADRSWEEFGRDCDDQIGRLIEADPAAARELLRSWHRELCKLPG